MTEHAISDWVRLHNRTQVTARLRFRCGDYLLWEASLQAGAKVQVRDPFRSRIDICMQYLDRRTRVTHTVMSQVAACASPVRLVAAVGGMPAGRSFGVTHEAHDRLDEIGLLNLTGDGIRCEMRFVGTPFQLACCLRSHASERVRLGPIEVAATLRGVTTRSVTIDSWGEEWWLEADRNDPLPRLHPSSCARPTHSIQNSGAFQ